MKEVFMVASFCDGNLKLLPTEYTTYPEAVTAINKMEKGVYQVQKVFVK